MSTETTAASSSPSPASGPGAAAAPLHWKLVVDCADPHRLAAFWAEALHYEVEDNGALVRRLLDAGVLPREAVVEFRGRLAFREMLAVRHPDDPYDEHSGTGLGRRLLFQRVPEPKSVKNRLHLDVHAGPERREEEVRRLVGLGASVLREEKQDQGSWVVMADPEGNEFCLA